MKLFTFIVLMSILVGCIFFSDGPGVLGSGPEIINDYPLYVLENKVEKLQKKSNFKINIKDSIIVQWWEIHQFDFLNYRCLKINNNLFMVTLDEGDESGSCIAIRAIYDRKKEKWIFAKKFTSKDTENSEKALKKLSFNLR